MNGSDACTAHVNILNVTELTTHVKMVKMVHFMYILSQLKVIKKEEVQARSLKLNCLRNYKKMPIFIFIISF